MDPLVVTGLTLAEVGAAPDRRLPYLHRRLIRDIADCSLERPPRPRVCDRVAKVKMSKCKPKRPHHQGHRDIEKTLRLVEAGATRIRQGDWC